MADGLCTSCQALLRAVDRWKKRDEQDRYRADTAEAEVDRLRAENAALGVVRDAARSLLLALDPGTADAFVDDLALAIEEADRG